MIRELIISFDYHSGKTVKKLRELELEKKNTEDKEKLDNLKKEIEILQSDYESKLKPVALEIAFNIDSQMEKMSEDEIFQKFQVKKCRFINGRRMCLQNLSKVRKTAIP